MKAKTKANQSNLNKAVSWIYVDYNYTTEMYEVKKQVRGITNDKVLKSYKSEVWAYKYKAQINCDELPKYEVLGYQLYATMPFSIVAHYADQKQVGTVDLCIDVVSRNPKWAERLFDEDTYSSLEDRIHDFVGMVNQDEHFVPRV